MQNQNKTGAAVYGEKSDGSLFLRGHNAVDPKGHLVLIDGDGELPDSEWHWATSGDLEAAESAEKKNAEKALRSPRKGGPIRGTK